MAFKSRLKQKHNWDNLLSEMICFGRKLRDDFDIEIQGCYVLNSLLEILIMNSKYSLSPVRENTVLMDIV